MNAHTGILMLLYEKLTENVPIFVENYLVIRSRVSYNSVTVAGATAMALRTRHYRLIVGLSRN